MSHPAATVVSVTRVFAAVAIGIFGFLFAWSDLIRDLGGRRLSALIGVLSFVSMWAAFTLDPAAAVAVIMEPGERIGEMMTNTIQNSLDGA